LSPIDQDSIEQQFNYTNIDSNNYENIKDQIENALIEACQHGSDYYRYFRSKITNALFANKFLGRNIGVNLDHFSSTQDKLMSRYGV